MPTGAKPAGGCNCCGALRTLAELLPAPCAGFGKFNPGSEENCGSILDAVLPVALLSMAKLSNTFELLPELVLTPVCKVTAAVAGVGSMENDEDDD